MTALLESTVQTLAIYGSLLWLKTSSFLALNVLPLNFSRNIVPALHALAKTRTNHPMGKKALHFIVFRVLQTYPTLCFESVPSATSQHVTDRSHLLHCAFATVNIYAKWGESSQTLKTVTRRLPIRAQVHIWDKKDSVSKTKNTTILTVLHQRITVITRDHLPTSL